MAAVRDGVERVLSAYNPFPCVVVDRGWQIVHANAGAGVLLEGVAPSLLERPNALRIALHPEGLAPRIRNLAQWRHHLIERLRREAAVSGSDDLSALLAEIESLSRRFRRDPRSRRCRGSVGALHPAGTAADIPVDGDDVRHGARPHRRRTVHRGVSSRRRGDGRRAAVKCTWRAANTNRVWRHGQPTRRGSRRCARRRRRRLLVAAGGALGGTTAKVTIDGKSTGDAHSVRVLADRVDVEYQDPRRGDSVHRVARTPATRSRFSRSISAISGASRAPSGRAASAKPK